MMKPCEICDELSEKPRCPKHQPTPKPRPVVQGKRAGYDSQWNRLSKRARKAQPFCLWCGATTDLQADHTPQAWERRDKGLPIRLEDVRVLCGSCNRSAGQARPGFGQRTSEDRPEPVLVRSHPTGRLLTPGGKGSTPLSLTPRLRQSLNNSPGTLTEQGQDGPW